MKMQARIWVVIAILSLGGCASNEQTEGSPEAPPDAAAVRSAAPADLPPVSVLIVHRVAAYDAWKQVFDDHQRARKEASCFGHYLKRGIDDADRVYIYCLATDVDRLRAFLESSDLAETMKHAGVQGAPELTVMTPMSRNLVPERKLPGIIVMHPVEDYDTWRAAYDGLEDFRRNSGIVGHAVSREFDDPNHVIFYLQANDVAALRAFADSAEFEDTLRRAGVEGDPDVHFIEVVGFAKY